MPSILFIIPYFGRWPFWMHLFIRSCAENSDIDWLFFSDCGVPGNLPANVRVKEISYSNYCALVSERLGIRFSPENPYKLCDIKQALGYIHCEELDGYDFWAFGDIDVVYGRLREYFDFDRLARYELLSTHARRVSGHMCLLKNNTRMREAFMLIPNWRERLADQQHHALDEGAFSRIFIWRKNFPKPLFNLVGKLNPWRRSSEFKEAFSTPNAGQPWVDGSYRFPQRWYWLEGRLTNDLNGEREFPYLHFFGWKRDVWPSASVPSEEKMLSLSRQKGWMISAEGFSSLPASVKAEQPAGEIV